MSKVYTKTGDKGQTSLVSGSRVSKAHLRLCAYGLVDELNSVLGMLGESISKLSPKKATPYSPEHLKSQMLTIQHQLFNLGSRLACDDQNVLAKLPPLAAQLVPDLEFAMDEMTTVLSPLRNFVLPGGSEASGWAHVARTVCRRAERDVVQAAESGQNIESSSIEFLNRLSDYFFVLSRYLLFLEDKNDHIWESQYLGFGLRNSGNSGNFATHSGSDEN